MKKIVAFVFVGTLAVSCSKKSDHALQDSNSMLQEPATTVVDSAAAQTPVDQGATDAVGVPAKTDSAAAK